MKLCGDVDRHLTMTLRITGAVGGDGERTLAKSLMSHHRKERAIDSAAVRDDDGAEREQNLPQRA
jgi:hypothetical protein